MQIGACMTGQAQMHAMDLAPVSWKEISVASPEMGVSKNRGGPPKMDGL